MRSTVGIPFLCAQAVAEGQGGGGCQGKTSSSVSAIAFEQIEHLVALISLTWHEDPAVDWTAVNTNDR